MTGQLWQSSFPFLCCWENAAVWKKWLILNLSQVSEYSLLPPLAVAIDRASPGLQQERAIKQPVLRPPPSQWQLVPAVYPIPVFFGSGLSYSKTVFFFCFFFCFFFFDHTLSMQKFPGQELKPHCSSDNAGSLSHWATISFFLYMNFRSYRSVHS